MADELPETAPDLGRPTNVGISDDTAESMLRGDPPEPEVEEAGADPSERTADTPDELGGAGGDQAGGVG